MGVASNHPFSYDCPFFTIHWGSPIENPWPPWPSPRHFSPRDANWASLRLESLASCETNPETTTPWVALSYRTPWVFMFLVIKEPCGISWYPYIHIILYNIRKVTFDKMWWLYLSRNLLASFIYFGITRCRSQSQTPLGSHSMDRHRSHLVILTAFILQIVFCGLYYNPSYKLIHTKRIPFITRDISATCWVSKWDEATNSGGFRAWETRRSAFSFNLCEVMSQGWGGKPRMGHFIIGCFFYSRGFISFGNWA